MQPQWLRTKLVLGLLTAGCFALFGCDGDGGNGEEDDTPPTTDAAFVLTSDFTTGSYSVIDQDARDTFPDIALGGIHSDVEVARLFNGRIYVVNRLGADNIQVIDPSQGYTTPAGQQLSVGNGSNPQDIAFVSATRAYVSRLASAQLLVMNPTTLTSTGAVDLRALRQPNDGDGVPDATHMLVHNGLLYVVLQHLDFSTGGIPARVAPGEVVVIDPTTDTVVTVIVLNGRNPFSQLQFNPALNRIFISSVGDFGINDGGLEAIDPLTNTSVAGFVIDEATIGGDITHFEIVSATRGFAIVSDANFANTLVSFNPTTGALLTTLAAGPADGFLPYFAVNSRNELYLAVNTPTALEAGIRIFDTTTEAELTPAPLNVGGLPPVFVLFLE